MTESLGTFKKERDTKNFWRYSRENEWGRKETQYVPKDVVEKLGDPEEIELLVKATES